MKVIKPLSLSLLTRPYEIRREFHLGVAVIACVSVGDVPALTSEQALWPMLAEELPEDQPLDAAMPKSVAEFLAVAVAHAPGGTPIPQLRVGIQLGSIIKTLGVTGDRYVLGEGGTQPVPFATMRLDWTRAYGGAGFDSNPIGRGIIPVDTAAGRLVPVPNVLNPKSGYRAPAGFGPLDQTWQPRARLIGTYDDRWLREDFPGFARDIDWRFFNVAPEDQQSPQGFTGTEAYALENLHPTEPLLRGTLPGMDAKAFITRSGSPDTLEEVSLKLTTVWFIPHRERVLLVHHGSTRVTEEDARDVARVMIAAERKGEPRPLNHYAEVFKVRTDRATAGLHALLDEELVPATWAPPPPGAAETAIMMARLERQVDRALERGNREAEKERARGRAYGYDVDRYSPPQPPLTRKPLPPLAELSAFVARFQAEADAIRSEVETKAVAEEAARAASMQAAGLTPGAALAAAGSKPKGPPPFSARDFLAQAAERDRATGLLANPIPNVPLSTDPTVRARAKKAETDARMLYHLSANHQNPANPASAARTVLVRDLLGRDPAAVRALYDLSGVDLSWLDLSGIDLSGVTLDGANLQGTSLAGADLVKAVLAHANLESAVLDGADLTGCNLGGARLRRTSLRSTKLVDAILSGADLAGAVLRKADLTGAQLLGTRFADTDLSEARACKIKALELTFTSVRAEGILLDRAQFVRCKLDGVDLNAASLFKTAFLDCDLVRARFQGANLRGAVFVQACRVGGADFAGADASGANFRGTQLAAARFDGATLAEADLSDADLQNASFKKTNASNTRFIAADLRGATFAGANLMGADLARADLRGADLTNVGGFGTNMSRVKLDAATRTAGIRSNKLRYLPRAVPPQ